ncbi:hypothetical protein VTJ04DRAFT_525 [Mycothermus thermophilus]|uniref:uncharacterized protein n=1 Tax=Humicola insolens TaxID=85995 RepID=UPI003743DA65
MVGPYGRQVELDVADGWTPYTGSHVGHPTAKQGGLAKRITFFTVGGRRFGVVAYYSVADALGNDAWLPRPRHHPRWNLVGTTVASLDPGLWGPIPRGQGFRPRRMRDDNGIGRTSEFEVWTNGNDVPVPAAPPQGQANAALPAATGPWLLSDRSFLTNADMSPQPAPAANPPAAAQPPADGQAAPQQPEILENYFEDSDVEVWDGDLEAEEDDE